MLAAKRTEGGPVSPLVGMMVLSDRATVQPIPRAKRTTTAARRSARRSKILVIEERCHIGFLSATAEGKANEKSLADLEGSPFPPGSGLDQAMGVQGDTGEGITIVQPQKKPPGGELTPPEKAANRAVSSSRIRIEHAIGGVKRDRIVKDKIRLLKDRIRDTIMETCCGLHNFRLQYRPWTYSN
jgi:DDE superfamily endonuclease